MKIFCIGLNKTATTTLHTVFKNAGLRSLHDSKWVKWTVENNHTELEKYDCFSDGLGFSDINFILQTFDDVKLVLNVRNLDRWLSSQYNHIWLHNQLHPQRKRNLSEKWMKESLYTRNIWHDYIIKKFDPLILNIEKEDNNDIVKKLNSIGVNCNSIPHINHHTNMDKSKKEKNRIIVNQFLEKHIKKDDMGEDIVIDYLPKYENDDQISSISIELKNKYY